MRTPSSRYLTTRSSRACTSRRSPAVISFLVALCLATAALFGGTLTNQNTAQAEEETAEEVLSKAAESYGANDKEGSFDKTAQKLQSENPDRNSFGFILDRLFTTGYINHTPDGTPSTMGEGRDWNCDVNNKHKGTLMYHNCDVPNIMTEFLQKFIQTFSPMGFNGATVSSAKTLNGFGVPSNIPTGEVPLDYADRTTKYTALEIFGYNFHYTSYRGEWDQIQVMNKARALSNFGLMDNVRLGASSVVNGVVSGVGKGASRSVENLKQGDIIGGVTGAFSGFFEGAATATVNSIIDTSDLNVFNTNAWYRVNFGSTLYNARELDQSETSGKIKSLFADLFSASKPDEAKLPVDFETFKNGPKKPQDAISKCVIGGKQVLKSERSPGPTRAECSEAAGSDRAFTWTEDGQKKQETLKAWVKKNDVFFTAASEYGITCKVDASGEGDRAQKLVSFYSCWSVEWEKVSAKVLKDTQSTTNQSWYDRLTTLKSLVTWFVTRPGDNFNAPWSRYVCVNPDGTDMLKNGKQVFLYSHKTGVNPECSPVRPPIQNGYFGNGYLEEQNMTVPIDTRYELVDKQSLMTLFVDIEGMGNSIANFGLSISSFSTKIANTILDVAFSPLMKRLGITDKFVKWIGEFRDGIYFPLILLMLGFMAISTLWKAGTGRNYNQGLISVLLSIGTFFVSVIVMYSPQTLFKVVDEVPTMIETAVAGTILTAGGPDHDEICSATGTKSTVGKGLDGFDLGVSPQAEIRSIECEVWRVLAFEPYVAGQWGTSYQNLYANSTTRPNKFTNTNGDLVGDAAVPMGGNRTENNWALYQLDVLTSGTTSYDDPSAGNNLVPRDIYRVVDVQAGPDGGAGTESRYLHSWSGNEMGNRLMVSLISTVSSTAAAFTIVIFGLVKIELAFISTVMLLFLPFILLIAVHPTFGRVKLKAYVGTIIGIMLQRVVLMALLAVMLQLLTGVSLSATSYLLMGIISTVISVMFLLKRKEILKLVRGSTDKGFGSLGGEGVTKSLVERLPKSAQNRVSVTKSAIQGGVSGAAAGFIVNGHKGIRPGAQRAMSIRKEQTDRLNARRGYGTLYSLSEGRKAGEHAGSKELMQKKRDLRGDKLHSDVTEEINERRMRSFEKAQEGHEGNPEDRPNAKSPEKLHLDLDDRKTLLSLDRLKGIEDKLTALEKEERIPPKNLPKKKPTTREEIMAAQSVIRAHKQRIARERDELNDERDQAMDDLYSYEVQKASATPDRREVRRRELKNMKDELGAAVDAARGRTDQERQRDWDIYTAPVREDDM